MYSPFVHRTFFNKIKKNKKNRRTWYIGMANLGKFFYYFLQMKTLTLLSAYSVSYIISNHQMAVLYDMLLSWFPWWEKMSVREVQQYIELRFQPERNLEVLSAKSWNNHG